MFVLSAFLLLATADQAPAAAAPAPASAPAAASAPVDERKICKRDESSGTRFAKRICLTEAEWRARDVGVRGLGDVAK
jgi:hypothetical protein